jgi:hypothetical protein
MISCGPRPEAGVQSSPAAAASAAPAATSWRIDAGSIGTSVHPIHGRIGVATDDGAIGVRYHRTRGEAAGIAVQLAPGTFSADDSIELIGSAQPEQRVHLCLTDANGVVWTFPTVKLRGERTVGVVRVADLRPDPFQNAGKTVPAAPDLASMTMLTVLDISGFMGGQVEECAWRVESLAVAGTEVGR